MTTLVPHASAKFGGTNVQSWALEDRGGGRNRGNGKTGGGTILFVATGGSVRRKTNKKLLNLQELFSVPEKTKYLKEVMLL